MSTSHWLGYPNAMEGLFRAPYRDALSTPHEPGHGVAIERFSDKRRKQGSFFCLAALGRRFPPSYGHELQGHERSASSDQP